LLLVDNPWDLGFTYSGFFLSGLNHGFVLSLILLLGAGRSTNK